MTVLDGIVSTGEDIVSWPFQAAGDFVTGAATTAGDAAGGLFGGLFGGLGNWLFQLAALGIVAWLTVQVVA